MTGIVRMMALAGLAAGMSLAAGSGMAGAEADEARPVEESLEKLKIQSESGVPPKVVEAGRRGVEELKLSGILERALKKGDAMPSFRLKDAHGREVGSSELLEKGPIVLVFYRGAWCPFCNLYLRSLQRYVPEFEARGASLVAVSVEGQDRSLTVEEKNALTFTVLSDPGLEVARLFKIVYEMPAVVNEAILELGFDLAAYNGMEKPELPLTVTYVIDRDGTIGWAFLDPDYKKRAEPADILAALDGLD